MSNDSNSKSVALPAFSGKTKDFAVFWPRFKAYATLKKFSKVLDSNTTDLPGDPNVLSIDTNTKEKQKKAIE